MTNSIPHRVWLIDCDPNCPGGMVHDQPYTCEGCGEAAIEYGPASELREVLKAVLFHFGPDGAQKVTTTAMNAIRTENTNG